MESLSTFIIVRGFDMCLGVPVRIVEKKNQEAIAEFKGLKRRISLKLLGKVRIGDYVILHAGFAIQKLDKKEALKTLQLFDQLGGLENE